RLKPDTTTVALRLSYVVSAFRRTSSSRPRFRRQRERRQVCAGRNHDVLPAVNGIRRRRCKDLGAGLVLKQLLTGLRVSGEKHSLVIAAEDDSAGCRQDARPTRIVVSDLP